jgi:hypothetical protein
MLEYISVSEGIGRRGLRLVLSASTPGPWSQAAKAIFDIKGIKYIPVRQVIGARDELLRQWTGQEAAPVAMFEDERPRARWDEILLLAERLATEPRLIPRDEGDRADMFGLANCLCGEDGLCWNVRLYQLHRDGILQHRVKQAPVEPDDPYRVALSEDGIATLQARYGDPTRTRDDIRARMIAIVELLARRYLANRARGSQYMIRDQLTALDVYWAVLSGVVCPFAEEHCKMPKFTREMRERNRALLGDALHPALIEHRDYILTKYFALPLNF